MTKYIELTVKLHLLYEPEAYEGGTIEEALEHEKSSLKEGESTIDDLYDLSIYDIVSWAIVESDEGTLT